MKWLKADFHCHTADDPRDHIAYSTEMLLDAVVRRGIEVMAVACHTHVAYTRRLSSYAAARGLVLVPAAELSIEGAHVVALNPDDEQASASTFAQLRRLGRRDAFFIAAHPFYPGKTCIGKRLIRNIDLFDAVEHCTLYYPFLNFNRKGITTARRFDLPLIGTSDTHALPYCDSTYTRVYADPTVTGVMEALRAGRVELVTQPSGVERALKALHFSALQAVRDWSLLSD